MVLEKIVSKLLGKYLGQYIEGFDKKSLKISLISGEVKLKNLQLQKSALDDLNLPIKIKFGLLENLFMKIPWRKLSKEPVIIKLEGIYLIVGPKEREDDSETINAQKKRRLLTAELFGLDKVEDEKPEKEDEVNDSFFEKLKIRAINNIQISVEKVHVRYEDSISENPFAFGVSIEGFHAQTVDDQWKPIFIKEIINNIVIKKLVQLKNLSVYLDTRIDQSILLYNESLAYNKGLEYLIKLARKMDTLIGKENSQDTDHTFIVHPLSCQLQFVNDDNQKRRLKSPITSLKFLLEKLNISLNREQYLSLMGLLKFLTIDPSTKVLISKPEALSKVRPSQNPKLWWKFAIDCALHLYKRDRERLKWDNIMRYRKATKEYVDLFKQSKQTKLDKKKLKRLEELEDILSYDDIIHYRKAAYKMITKEKKLKKENKKGFFSSLFGDSKKSIINNKDAMKEIYNVIEYDEKVDNKKIEFPKEYIKTNLDLVVKHISFKLIETEKDPSKIISTLDIVDTGLTVSIRDNDSISALASILDINLYQNVQNSKKPIIYPCKEVKSLKTVILSADINPYDTPNPVDLRLITQTQPFNVIVTKPLIQRLIQFFKLNERVVMKNLVNITSLAIDMVKDRAANHLKSMINSKATLILDIRLPSPKIIVDVSDTQQLIVSPGDTNITCDTSKRKNSLPENIGDISQLDDDLIYDQYNLKTSGISVYFNNAVESNKKYIIDEFNLSFSLKLRAIKSLKHPKLLISSNIGLMKLYVSKSTIESIMSVIIPYIKMVDDEDGSLNQPKIFSNNSNSLDTFFLDDILESESESESEQETLFKAKKKKTTRSLLKASLNLEGIRVNIQETKNESLNLIALVISQISTNMNRTTDYFDLNVSLTQLYIEDNYSTRQIGDNKKPLQYLIHPHQGSKLISLAFKNIYQSSDQYNLINNELKIMMSSIEVSVNRLTLAALLLFFNDLAKVIAKSIPKSNNTEDILKIQPHHNIANYMEPNTVITISAGLEEIRINLTKESSTFFTVFARDFSVDINAKGNGVTYVSGSVRSLQGYVIDDFKWNKLIESTGKHVGNFSITHYNENSKSRENYDIHFKSSIEGIRVVVMSKVIEEIATYFLEFLKILAFIGYPETKDSIIRLSVHVKDPHVIIPLSSNSDEYFKINLGNTEIKSTIKDIEKNLFNDISILLTQFNLSSYREVESKEIKELTVIEDITLSMSLLQLLNQNQSNKDIPAVKINGNVNDIKIKVSDFLLSKVSSLMTGNLIEEIPRKDKEVVDLVKQIKQMDLTFFQEILGDVEKAKSSFNIIHFSANKLEIVVSRFEQNTHHDLLLLELAQLTSDINTFHDESVRIKAGVRSIQIEDVQSKSKDYRCILKPHREFEERDHLSIYFDLYPNENIQFITFELQKSHIFVVNSFIQSVTPFILSTMTPFIESLDAIAERDTSSINEYLQLLYEYKLNKLKQEHSRKLKERMKNQSRLIEELGDLSRESLDTAKYQNANEIRALRAQFKKEIEIFSKSKGSIGNNETIFKVQIYSPEIFIVDDNKDTILNLVIHLGDSMIKYSTTLKQDKIRLSLYDFKACKCIVEKETQKLVDEKLLIKPFDISIHADISKEDHTNIIDFDFNLSGLKINVSYHDIKLCFGFSNHFMEMAEKLGNIESNQTKSVQLHKQDTSKEKQKNHIIAAKIAIGNIVVNVINDLDLKNIYPLTKLYIQNLQGKLNYPSNKSSFKLFGLEFDTYNSDINSFEPLLEPTDILFSAISKNKVSDLYAEALTPINLNVSKSCIDTGIAVSIMAEKILKAFEKKKLTKTSKNVGLGEYKSEIKTPYIVRNETGYNITMTLYEYDHTKTFDIKNMESLSFDVLKENENSTYLIDVLIEYEANKVILQKIPIDIVQYKVYEISSLNVKFVSEIVREEGVKVIIIRTPDVFNNQTPYELEIVYANENRGMFVLPAYSKRAINCLDRHDSFLVRPYKKDYHYSSCSINSSSLGCINENDERWTCYLQKKIVKRNNEEEIELIFTSLLVFENLLPVIIVLKSDGDTQMFDSSISPGKAYEIYETKFKNPKSISYMVQVGGHKWSPTIHTNVSDESTDKEIVIEDLNNQFITFFLNYETQSEKCTKISIYSKYWIINQTGLFLNYKSSNRKNYISDYFKDINLDSDPVTWYKTGSNLKAHKVFFYDKDISVQIGNYNISSSFINITNNENIEEKKLILTDNSKGRGFYFTLSLSSVLGKLWRTKEIRIVPSFIVVNKSNFDIKYRQVGCNPFNLVNDKSLPFHWPNNSKPKELEISISGEVWSQPFKLISPSNFMIKLLNVKEKQATLISVNIYEESGITYTTFSPGSYGIAHFNVENKTLIDIGICQSNPTYEFFEKIQRLSNVQYHMDNTRIKDILLKTYDGSTLTMPLKLNCETNYDKIPWKVGGQEFFVTLSCNDIFRKLIIEDSSIEDNEPPSSLDLIFTSLSLHIPQIGISIIEQTKEKTLKELFYICFSSISASLYNNFHKSTDLSLTIKHLQIDQNYLHPNKPILWGIPSKETQNFLSFKTTINKDIASEIILFENLSIDAQTIEVSLTTDMLVLLSSFIEETINYIIIQKGLTTEILSSEQYLPEIRSGVLDKLFFRDININKVKIIFSLLRDVRRIKKKSMLGVAINILSILLKISTISRANLNISSFKHSQKIQSSHYIFDNAGKHYINKFQSQIKKILLTYVKSIFVSNRYPITPIRPPRYFLQGIIISKYDIELSYGQYLLNEFASREYYLFHIWINKNCILSSNKRLYCISNQRLIWSENSEDLKEITSKDLKVILHFECNNTRKEIEIDCKTRGQVEKLVHEFDVIIKMNQSYVLKD